MKKRLMYGVLVIVATIIVSLLGYLVIIYAGDYVIDEKKLVMNSATVLVNEKGNTITKLFIENRDLVSIDEVPSHVQEAFLAVEDARFYDHHGIDMKSIFRAVYKDILAGGKVEGGSTITQQLAKNVFLTNEKTLLRKTKEVVIALNLEQEYSKQKLLEMYLNQIYFGHGVYGIQAASTFYFHKDSSELTIEEGALLAALPKSPTNYSPIVHPKKSKERRNLILSLMHKNGYLHAEETVRLQGRTLGLKVERGEETPAYLTYIDMVLEEAKEKYALSNEELLRGGYTITVPMDVNIQHVAFELFQQDDYFPGVDQQVQGAFVLMDQKTGGVLASIGGRNYVRKGLNRVNIKRQPGSTMKPIAVYGPALEEELFTPYSLLEDKMRNYGDYLPRNYNNKYQQEITMYDAIVESANAPAVWTLNELGIQTAKKYLKNVSITIPDQGLAIALGGLQEGVTPLELARAYRPFASGGTMTEPFFISKIVDRNGEIVSNNEQKEVKVYSAQTAWSMTRMLQAVVTEGTGSYGEYNGALAGKTGTTSHPHVNGKSKDAWFVGYTPNMVGSLWMGYDETDKDHYLTGGSSFPTRLFKKILEESTTEKPIAFSIPQDVTDLEKPIHLEAISDLDANLMIKPLGLFTVSLTWTPADDERTVYRIYKKKNETVELIGETTGKGSYEIERVNIFSLPSYVVIPFNKQTNKEGLPSNIAKPEVFSAN